jgi:hypothetical protein
MTHIWQGLRSGAWLTASRARGYSLILLAICALVMAGWIAAADGLIDRNGKAIGTNFSNVHAAGQLTWQGRAADAYQAALQHAESLLATPYVLDYDLVVLAVAIAFFARHGLIGGFRDFEISLLAAASIVPLLSRGLAGVSGIPLGLMVLLALYLGTFRRALLDKENSASIAARIAQA